MNIFLIIIILIVIFFIFLKRYNNKDFNEKDNLKELIMKAKIKNIEDTKRAKILEEIRRNKIHLEYLENALSKTLELLKKGEIEILAYGDSEFRFYNEIFGNAKNFVSSNDPSRRSYIIEINEKGIKKLKKEIEKTKLEISNLEKGK